MIVQELRFLIASNHVYKIAARYDVESALKFDHKLLPGNPDKKVNYEKRDKMLNNVKIDSCLTNGK